VAFDDTPCTGFVEVSKKSARGRRHNRRKRNLATGPTAATAPPAVPMAVSAPPAPTGGAIYSRIAAAPSAPPVPHMTRPGRQVRSRLVPSPPPAPVRPGPSGARVPTASPFPNTREGHITMRFDVGKQTQLPVTPEAIRICMKQTLSNLGKVSDKTPYIREAGPKLEIGCIYLTLAEHTPM